MKNYLMTWQTEDDKKIKEFLENMNVTVTENNEEDAILKGSCLIMEIIAKNSKMRCESTLEDDGICIKVFDQKMRRVAELKSLRAREIWEV